MESFYSGLVVDVDNFGRCTVVNALEGSAHMIVDLNGSQITVLKNHCTAARDFVDKPAKAKPAAKKPAPKKPAAKKTAKRG